MVKKQMNLPGRAKKPNSPNFGMKSVPSKGKGLKAGGMAHGDATQDKAMIKKMVKPSAMKMKKGGVAKKKSGKC